MLPPYTRPFNRVFIASLATSARGSQKQENSKDRVTLGCRMSLIRSIGAHFTLDLTRVLAARSLFSAKGTKSTEISIFTVFQVPDTFSRNVSRTILLVWPPLYRPGSSNTGPGPSYTGLYTGYGSVPPWHPGYTLPVLRPVCQACGTSAGDED